MKICCNCKEDKPISEFNRNRAKSDGYNTICRECSKIRSKQYYNEHGEVHKKNVRRLNKAYERRLRKFANAIKSSGCALCGEHSLCCMQFHHVDSSLKSDDVARLLGNVSKQKLLDEIVKCIILCANCHCKVHAGLLDVSSIPLIVPTKEQLSLLDNPLDCELKRKAYNK